MNDFQHVADIIRNARSCVVLTGAGISAESGVPTFRGKEGLWGKFRPEELATMDAFLANPNIVWEFYNFRRDVISGVEPNPGHYALTELEDLKEDFVLVTQNVDGLHAEAGSRNILELHGNLRKNKCVNCNRPFLSDEEIDPNNIPSCQHCGGQIRPDVVWFGEMLDPDTIHAAFDHSERTDVFLSVGTSAIVHPAASLPIAAERAGATLIEINPEPTPISELAEYRFDRPSGEFLPLLIEEIRQSLEPQ